jgi:dUTP pyrophosphatase
MEIKVINNSNNELPQYETKGAAGFDLRAYITEKNNDNPSDGEFYTAIKPNSSKLIPTGLQMAIPEGYELQVRPRSGLAFKKGITVLNSPGTIDSDYRGDIGVILHNTSDKIFIVYNGDRIAQGVLNEVPQGTFIEVESLDETDRGEGGFGSTGK